MRFSWFVSPLFRSLAVLLVVPAVLAGCTSMPVTSMVKLARTDFTTVDPAVLRVAVRLPTGVRPLPRSVTLRLAVKAGPAPPVTQEFVLADLADAGELIDLRREVAEGTAVYGYRLDPADAAKVVTLRNEMMARKSRGERGSLTLSVGAKACRAEGAPDRVLLTTYLKTEPGGDFFPLLRNIDLREVAGQAVSAELPPCG